MFHEILQIMDQQAGQKLDQGPNARALWYREWARQNLDAFDGGKPVVYTSGYSFPMEILHAMDVAPFDFELSSGIIGSTPMGVSALEVAEERGMPPDVCSYHRISLGASYQESFPKPDLLVTCSFYCDGKVKTNETLARLYGKETALLYVPAEITRDSIDYVAGQLRRIADRIGQVAGKKLDMDRLGEAVASANRARHSQNEMLQMLRHKPAPWGGRHMITYSIISNLFVGSPVLERLNEAFLADMEQRITSGKLREESFRLYWFAWVPTYPANLFDVLKQHRAAVPLCETHRIFWDEIDPDDPFEGLALKCLQNPFVGPGSRRTEGLAEIREQYALDGAILFATPACRHSKTACRLLTDTLAKMDLPLLTLDVDIADPRGYAPEAVQTRIEGFLEMLEQRRGAIG